MNHIPQNLPEILLQSVEMYPENIAISNIGETPITYRQLLEDVEQLAQGLLDHGMGPGKKIALLSENSVNWVKTFWAILYVGATAVPILPDFSVYEVNNILEHAEVDMLFISNRIWRKHHTMLSFEKTTIQNDYYTKAHDNHSIMRHPDSSESMHESIRHISPEDLATIIYTSGTTGTSKGVMLCHRNYIHVTTKVVGVQDVNSFDRYLSLLPLSHIYESVLGMILPIRQGASVYYIKKLPTPSILMDSLQLVKPTMILLVPLIMDKLYLSRIYPHMVKHKIIKGIIHVWPVKHILHRLARKKVVAAFGGKIRFIGIGGAALNPRTEGFLRDAQLPYSCGYGLTETTSLIFGSKVGHVKKGSVGKPLDGVEYRIVKSKDSKRVGEVVVRWDGNMLGYYKEKGKTSEVLTPDNWFHTGDLAEFVNGNLYLRGRSKTMILGPSGENVYPEEIEAVINQQDGVLESYVFEAKGRIKAKVYLNIEELAQQYSFLKEASKYHSNDIHTKINSYLTELKNKINSHLNRFSQINEIELSVTPFEKTATNKIKRY